MLQNIESLLGIDPETQVKILLSALTVLVIWAVRRVTLQMVQTRLASARARYQWSKSSGYVGVLLVLLVWGQIWLEAIQGMGAFLGLLSAGLAIALRDLVANMAGWAFILLRHPLTVGDRVQVGEHRGDVVDIRLFQFTILEIGNWVDADQSTGRIVHIPNSRIFSDPLANFTSGFAYLWHEIPVLVTFESNWQKAKEILQRVVDEQAGEIGTEAEAQVRSASRRFLIHYGTLTPKVYTSVRDSGVLLTLRFLSPVRRRRGLDEQIWESILEAFHAESDIDLAYPTQRLYANFLEGKKEARAEVSDILTMDSRSEPRSPGGSR